jgi:hypothetical protein
MVFVDLSQRFFLPYLNGVRLLLEVALHYKSIKNMQTKQTISIIETVGNMVSAVARSPTVTFVKIG